MTLGMATIAGAVLALYASLLNGVVTNPIGHLLTASLVSASAAMMFSRLMLPQTQVAPWRHCLPVQWPV